MARWNPRSNSRGTKGSSRLVKAAWVVIIVSAVFSIVFYGVGGWYFAQKLDSLALSGAARRSLKPSYTVPVLHVSGDSITLARNSASPYELTTPGTWGIEWADGQGSVSTIISSSAGSTQRRFRLVVGSAPSPGQKVEINTRANPGNPAAAFSLHYQNLYYKGPLGNYPAWFIPGSNSTWAITVHGNAMTRLDGMNDVPVLHSLGYPILMITYRNDPGAPESKSGLLRYGLTEWQDLQASVDFAIHHGAHHVVLLGYSMGGAVVTNFMLQSKLADKVSAIVLDAPVLDFSTTVDYGASQMYLPGTPVKLPPSLTDVAKWIAAWQYGVKWGQMDYLRNIHKITTPILLYQGLNDNTVPPATSAALARALPNQVTYVTTPGAGHLESWNFHPNAYDSKLRTFLSAHQAEG